jgi:hypothetical protein
MTEYKNIILIPYRNRNEHLDIFIKDVIPLFEKYLQPYKVVVIEQEQGKLFNRGMLLNIGFNEYKDKSEYFFTHDVDIIPNEECVKTLYTKTDISCITGIYTSSCNTLGGIIKFTPECFIKSNGFPNNYWGWGVEDKVLQNRVEYMNININKNILTNDINRFNYFTIKNDIDDRHYDNLDHKTSFEYTEFNNLTTENKLIHIMKSGLNNLEYKIISREYIRDDRDDKDDRDNVTIERIKVSI